MEEKGPAIRPTEKNPRGNQQGIFGPYRFPSKPTEEREAPVGTGEGNQQGSSCPYRFPSRPTEERGASVRVDGRAGEGIGGRTDWI